MSDSKLFVLDANAFIAPYRQYYAFDLVPAYWDAIKPFINSGRVLLVDLVKNELDKGGDSLAKWLNDNEEITVIGRANNDVLMKYQQIIRYISSCGFYTQNGIRVWSGTSIADPWLIAVAAVYGYTIVTLEVPIDNLSTKNRTNKIKIPDVAKHFGVETITVFEMMRRLGVVITK